MPKVNKSKQQYLQPLYANSAQVDEKTGLPQDYDSLLAAYRPLMLSVAERAKLPIQDREDAAQELQLKFWQKNGLAMFDPTKGTKFATLYRSWASKFILQERDKYIKSQRTVQVDPFELQKEYLLDTNPHPGVDREVVSNLFVSGWVRGAESALETSGHGGLLPLFRACVRAAETGTALSRAEISKVTGVPIDKATAQIGILRTVLAEAGLGAESLV